MEMKRDTCFTLYRNVPLARVIVQKARTVGFLTAVRVIPQPRVSVLVFS